MHPGPLGAKLIATIGSDKISLTSSLAFFSSKLNKIFVLGHDYRLDADADDGCYRTLHIFDCNYRNDYTSIPFPALDSIRSIKLVSEAGVFVVITDKHCSEIYVINTYGVVVTKIKIRSFKTDFAPSLAVSGNTAVIAGGYSDSIVILKFSDNAGAHELTVTTSKVKIAYMVCEKMVDNRYILCRIEQSNYVSLVDIYTGEICEMPIIIGGCRAPCLATDDGRIYFGLDRCLLELRKDDMNQSLYKLSRSFIGITGGIDDILRYAGKTMTVVNYELSDRGDDSYDYVVIEIDLDNGRSGHVYNNSEPSQLCPDCDSGDKYCAIVVSKWRGKYPREFAVYVVDGV
jgi:hypothetical protein